jgi:cytoskeletal protein RodZ
MASKPAQLVSDSRTHLDLRGARVRNGVSLEHVMSITKIGRNFLEAIEAEEFGKLPGGVFNTSYLRQYAGATGYDPETLLAYYRAQTEENLAAASPASAVSSKECVSTSKRLAVRWFRMLSPEPRF